MIKTVVSRALSKRVILNIALLVFILVAEIGLTVALPEVKKFFFNIVEKKDVGGLYYALGVFFSVMITLGCVQGVKTYVAQKAALSFRVSAAKYLLKKWVKGSGVGIQKIDNPCQRIAEDCKLATDLTISVAIEVIISALIVIILVWQTRSDVMMLVAAFSYTAIVTGVMLFFKEPLISSEISLQKSEADYRFSLSKITMGQGDYSSKQKFTMVQEAYKAFIKVLMNYTLFNRIQGGLSALVPFLILLPQYFSNTIDLGAVMAGVSTFELIVINASIILQLYPQVTKAHASWRRLKNFDMALESNKL